MVPTVGVSFHFHFLCINIVIKEPQSYTLFLNTDVSFIDFNTKNYDKCPSHQPQIIKNKKSPSLLGEGLGRGFTLL